MNRFTTSLIVFLLALKVHAQSFEIVFQPYNPYFFNVTSVTSFSVLNPTQQSQKGTIEIDLFKQGSLPLMNGNSSMVTFSTGVNTLENNFHSHLFFTYTADLSATYFKNTGFLPPGTYSLCVKVKDMQNATLAYSCEELSITPISPPQLIYPFNEQVIETTLPNLSWTPVMPSAIPKLEYKMDLWEITAQGAGQSLKASVKTPSNNFQYRSGLSELEYGHYYRWQVNAYAGNYFLGSSQTWTFRIGTQSNNNLREPEVEETDTTLSEFYRVIGDVTLGAEYVARGILRIAYSNVANDTALLYTIAPADQPDMYLDSLPVAPLLSGVNSLDIDLDSTGLFETNTEYTLEIEDGNNRHYYLTFLYTNP